MKNNKVNVLVHTDIPETTLKRGTLIPGFDDIEDATEWVAKYHIEEYVLVGSMTKLKEV